MRMLNKQNAKIYRDKKPFVRIYHNRIGAFPTRRNFRTQFFYNSRRTAVCRVNVKPNVFILNNFGYLRNRVNCRCRSCADSSDNRNGNNSVFLVFGNRFRKFFRKHRKILISWNFTHCVKTKTKRNSGFFNRRVRFFGNVNSRFWQGKHSVSSDFPWENKFPRRRKRVH